jgi:DNA-binding CsgD family transcriptional regulator
LFPEAIVVGIRRSSYPRRVRRLSESDYRGVLDVLGEASAVEGPIAFTRPVLEALRRLVPCDVVAYHELLGPSGRQYVRYAGDPHGTMTAEIRAAVRCHWTSDPLAVPHDGARKYSDFLSRHELHRTPMYQTANRPLGIEHMMCLWLVRAGVSRIEFDREHEDFDERDRAVLDVMRSHLVQFRSNALRRGHRPGSHGGPLTPREHEILELVAEGRQNAEVASILWISPSTVRKHLENAYEKLGVRTRTGAVAALRELRARTSADRSSVT